MLGRPDRQRRNRRPFLAWLGFVLMVSSFVGLQLLPSRSKPPTVANSTDEPFALVILDPGHGGDDSGTMKAGLMEKELTLDVAYRAERLLQLRGFATLLTRYGDTYVPLAGRAAIANEQPHCIFISIHFDDATRPAATGVETYYAAHQISSNPRPILSWLPFLQRTAFEPPNVESQNLASVIQEALVTHTQAVNRGTRPQQFFVIANVHHPAVLVEGGFLTNTDEMNKLATGDYREQIAAAISEGVDRYREVLRQQRTMPVAVIHSPGE